MLSPLVVDRVAKTIHSSMSSDCLTDATSNLQENCCTESKTLPSIPFSIWETS